MNGLKEQVLKLAELAFEPKPINDLSPDEFIERDAIACENARLMPLIEVLAERLEASQKVLSMMGKGGLPPDKTADEWADFVIPYIDQALQENASAIAKFAGGK